MLTSGAESASPVSPVFANFRVWGNGETWNMTLLPMHKDFKMKDALNVNFNTSIT